MPKIGGLAKRFVFDLSWNFQASCSMDPWKPKCKKNAFDLQLSMPKVGDTLLNSLMDSITNPTGENNRRIRSWGTLFGSRHLRGKGACWSSEMGTRESDKKINYSHKLAQTKQQVGWCVVGTLLVHGRTTSKHKFTRLTTIWI